MALPRVSELGLYVGDARIVITNNTIETLNAKYVLHEAPPDS